MSAAHATPYRRLAGDAAAALDKELLDGFATVDRRRIRRARMILGVLIAVAVGLVGLVVVYSVRVALTTSVEERAVAAKKAEHGSFTPDPCWGCWRVRRWSGAGTGGRCARVCSGPGVCAVATAYAIEPPDCPAQCSEHCGH